MPTKRKAAGASAPARVAKTSPKGPTSAQYAVMAGAMYNALERLRTFQRTLAAASAVSSDGAANGCIVLHPSEKETLLSEIAAAVNILRVGLKARFAKERNL